MSLARNFAGLPRYASPATVAEALEVSTLTVRRWIYSGKLPAQKVGRNVRIRARDVETFLGRHPFQPAAATAVDPEGRAVPFTTPELRARRRRALEVLADDAGPDDPEQIATLAAITPGLIGGPS